MITTEQRLTTIRQEFPVTRRLAYLKTFFSMVVLAWACTGSRREPERPGFYGLRCWAVWRASRNISSASTSCGSSTGCPG